MTIGGYIFSCVHMGIRAPTFQGYIGLMQVKLLDIYCVCVCFNTQALPTCEKPSPFSVLVRYQGLP